MYQRLSAGKPLCACFRQKGLVASGGRGKRFFREVSLPTRPRAIIGYLIAAELVPAGAGAMTANNRSLATVDHEP